MPLFAKLKNMAMFKLLCGFLLTYIFFSCGSPDEKLSEKVANETTTAATAPLSLEPFADSIVRLDKYTPENMEKLGYYFQKLVPVDSTLADSAAVLFLNFAWSIADTVNQKLFKDPTDYMDLVYEGGNPPTEKQKAFQQGLKKNHLDLRGDGEGGVIAILDYDWIKSVIKPKTSSAFDDYLSLLAAEQSEPTLQDAALAIGMKELVSRSLLSERLEMQQLPATIAFNMKKNSKFYIDLLRVGSDNTPSLDDEKKLTLTPEFKQGYDYVMATYPTSKTAEKIKEWLAILKAKNRKKIEEIRTAMYQ